MTQPSAAHRQQPASGPGTGRNTSQGSPNDALRGSRTSHTWVALLLLLVPLVLLVIFIIQNTQQVEVTYFGWTGQAPMAAVLLIAAATGLLIAGIAGSLRIWQLRRRIRKMGA